MQQTSGPIQILIAEDSPTQAERLRGMLERNGYTVIAARNGVEALEAARTHSPAIVISDIVMPLMDGYALCRAMKEDAALRDIPVVLVTDLSRPQDVVLGLECGADNFIRKPLQEKYLMQRVGYLLTNRALRDVEKLNVGIQIDLRGTRHFITAGRQQILDLLISMYEEAVTLNQNLESSVQSLNGLYRVAEGLNNCATEEETIGRVLERVSDFPGVAGAWIYLQEDGKPLRFAGARGIAPEMPVCDGPARACWCARALGEGSLGRACNALDCELATGAQGLHASVPLWGKTGLLGVMNIAPLEPEPFAEDELHMFEGVGQQAGLAIDRARLFEHLEQLVNERTAALRESERWFRAVFQAQGDAVFVMRPGGGIADANRAAEEMFGHAASEMKDKHSALLHADGDGAARFDAFLKDAIESGNSARFECALRRKSGEAFPAELTVSPLANEDGTAAGTICVVRDTTQRKQAEAELKKVREQYYQSQKMEAIGVLASGIAHDMNNILASVLGFTELMLQSMPSGSPHYEDLETVRDAGMRGAELVKQILAFSRRQILERSVLDLNKVVTTYHAFIARVIGENIQTCLNLARELQPVLADETQIGQVLMNLAVNARDAMQKGGSLTIETANVSLDEDYVTAQFTLVRGAYILLAVSDTGHGMDAETQARIFEPFFTTKEVGRGTGLGLSTVYGIVKQHGGYILADSTIGAGTTFKVYLPVTERLVKSAKPAGVERPLNGNETVLVVEDDDKIRNLICTILRKHGYTALDAPHGHAALEREAGHAAQIDLLLTDVMMPGMDGRELYRNMRVRRGKIRVLYSSGHAHDVIDTQRPFDNGEIFIAKPFAIRALLEKVREVLDREGTV